MKKINFTILCMVLLILSSIGIKSLSKFDIANANSEIYLNNVGVTKCWKGTCGHKSTYYDYPAYSSSGRITTCYFTGYYLDPGVTQTVSYSKSVSQTMTIGGDISSNIAKASVGFSGGKTKTMTVSQSLKNTTKTRKYAHIGVECVNRSNTVTKKTRTYYPFQHLTATNKTCQYSIKKAYPKCKVPVASGLSLKGTIINS